MATDTEVDQLKQSVSIATLLERNGAGWRVDESDSTRNAIKYRRGPGEIIIVNHQGKGWWDPTSDKSGDVFTLAQHLNPDMNFGEARKLLRSLAGIAPSYPAFERKTEAEKPEIPIADRWGNRRPLNEGSAAWRYLTEQRGLDAETLTAASRQGAVKEGPYSSAWFAHRDHSGSVVGIEGRGPEYHGFSKDGNKTLFRFTPGNEPPSRIAVSEGSIDALSLAQLEKGKNGGQFRTDTMYVATGGGIGPHSVEALKTDLAALPATSGTRMTIATDNDITGDRMSERLQEIAREAGVPASRLKPPGPIKDWNEQIQIIAGIIPYPDAQKPNQQPKPQAAEDPKTDATQPKTEPRMSQTTQANEPPRATRADQPAPTRPDADTQARGASASPKETSDSAAKKDPMVELLEQMKKLVEQMPGDEGKKFLRDINQLLQTTENPIALQNSLVLSDVARLVFSFEKTSGQQLTMTGSLRSEITDRLMSNADQSTTNAQRPTAATTAGIDIDSPRRATVQSSPPSSTTNGQVAPEKEAETVRVVGGGARSGFMDGVARIVDTVVNRPEKDKPAEQVPPVPGNNTAPATEARQQRPAVGEADAQPARAASTPDPASQDPVTARHRVEPTVARPAAPAPMPEGVTLGDVPRERTPVSDSTRDSARVEPKFTQPAVTSSAGEPGSSVETQRERIAVSDAARERVRVDPPPLERTATERQSWTTEPERQNYAGKAVVEAAFGTARPAEGTTRQMDASPPWPLNQGSGDSLADRIARKAREGAEDRLDPEITKTQQAGRNAAAAIDELMSGPARGIQAKISAAAQSEPGGINTVISEMRPDGKYAGLRSEFDGAIQQNEAFARSYDKAVGALNEYGKQKSGLEQRFDQFQQDKGLLKEKLGGIEEGLAGASAAIPGKQPGKSMMEELGEKLNEFFKKVVDTVKQAFGFNQASNQREADNGPRPN